MTQVTLPTVAQSASPTRSSRINGDRYPVLSEVLLEALSEILEMLHGDQSPIMDILAGAFADWSLDILTAGYLYEDGSLEEPEDEEPPQIRPDLPDYSDELVFEGVLERDESRQIGSFIELLLEDYSIWQHKDTRAAQVACHVLLCQLLNPVADRPRSEDGSITITISDWLVSEATGSFEGSEIGTVLSEVFVDLMDRGEAQSINNKMFDLSIEDHARTRLLALLEESQSPGRTSAPMSQALLSLIGSVSERDAELVSDAA